MYQVQRVFLAYRRVCSEMVGVKKEDSMSGDIGDGNSLVSVMPKTKCPIS